MNNTALITGASSGIGLELARILARENYNLILTARREEKLQQIRMELEKTHGTTVYIYPADLSEEDTPEKLYKFTHDLPVAVNVLINNAGVGDYGEFHTSDWDINATMIHLNIRSLTHLTRLYLPDFVQKDRAYVMNVASTAAFQPGPLMSVYYASKHYVLAFSEAIANELSGTGVTVTTLCPGPTKSEFQKNAGMEKSKLFDRFPVASSRDVAEYGYRAMKKGKRVAIYGFQNKIAPLIIGILPRNLVTSVVRKIQERN